VNHQYLELKMLKKMLRNKKYSQKLLRGHRVGKMHLKSTQMKKLINQKGKIIKK